MVRICLLVVLLLKYLAVAEGQVLLVAVGVGHGARLAAALATSARCGSISERIPCLARSPAYRG